MIELSSHFSPLVERHLLPAFDSRPSSHSLLDTFDAVSPGKKIFICGSSSCSALLMLTPWLPPSLSLSWPPREGPGTPSRCKSTEKYFTFLESTYIEMKGVCDILPERETRPPVFFRRRPRRWRSLRHPLSEPDLQETLSHNTYSFSLSPALTLCEPVEVGHRLCGGLPERPPAQTPHLAPVLTLEVLWPGHGGVAHYQAVNAVLDKRV